MKNKNHESLNLANLEQFLETKSNLALSILMSNEPDLIPSWHHGMVLDQRRYDFYKLEIDSAAKDKIVLDLGSGSGLLTQLALDAGAKHVYAVEIHPVLSTCFAHSFRKEIEEGKVTLLAKSSEKLTKEDFIKGAPQVLVHELFGSNPLAENVLNIFDDLFQRDIISPSLAFIPQSFKIWGVLNKTELSSGIPNERMNKFWYLEDLCYFGRTFNPNKKLEKVSKDFHLFTYDLEDLSKIVRNEFVVQANNEGNCVRVWFEIQGKASVLTTDIDQNESNHWGNIHYYLKFKQGEVYIECEHYQGNLTFQTT